MYLYTFNTAFPALQALVSPSGNVNVVLMISSSILMNAYIPPSSGVSVLWGAVVDE